MNMQLAFTVGFATRGMRLVSLQSARHSLAVSPRWTPGRQVGVARHILPLRLRFEHIYSLATSKTGSNVTENGKQAETDGKVVAIDALNDARRVFVTESDKQFCDNEVPGTGLYQEELTQRTLSDGNGFYPTWNEEVCPAFHLPTAVALGHCSFEAYNAPPNIHGVKELDPYGTETVYMDREFMEEVVTGVLAIHIDSAALAFQPKFASAARPSLTVCLGPSAEFKQERVEWGETLYLYVRDAEQQQLELLVKAQVNGKSGDVPEVVAKTVLGNLSAICDGELHELEVPFQGGGCADGDGNSDMVLSRNMGLCGLRICSPNGEVAVLNMNARYLPHGEEFDAIGKLPKLALVQMRGDDGWGELDNLDEEWADPNPVVLPTEDHGRSRSPHFAGATSQDQHEMASSRDDTSEKKQKSVAVVCKAIEQVEQVSADEDFDEKGANLKSLERILKRTQTVDAEDLAVALSPGDQIASGVPPDREDFACWTTLRDEVARRDLSSQLQPIAFVVNPERDTEAWVYRNKEKKEAVFAFRGTSSPQDMVTDSAFVLAAYSPGDRPPSRSPEEVAAEIADEETVGGPLQSVFSAIDSLERIPGIDALGGLTPAVSWVKNLRGWAKSQLYSFEHNEKWVHKGFLEAYSAVQARIVSMAREIMKDDGSEQPWKLYVTGHSLGGALAILCAYELKSTRWEGLPQPEVIVYTFGQPMVGNVAFAEDYDKLVPHTWRVKNVNDIVTRVPAVLGYCHVGCEATVCTDGGIMLATAARDDLQDSVAMEEIIERITNQVRFDDVEKAKEKLEGVLEKEMGLWRSLFTGAAVLEHMESKYHEVLKTCIDAGGERCQPVIKAIDGRPTKEQVLRLLKEADSSKELLPTPERGEASVSASFDDCPLKILAASRTRDQENQKPVAAGDD
eukprot:jgi/Botrbrau1/3996/Bobra.0016s0008.1